MLSALIALSLTAHAQDADADKGAKVEIESTKPGLVISVVDGRATGVSSRGGTVLATYYRDLCIAPCVADMEPQILEVFGKGGGRVAVASKLDIRNGNNKILVEPGSSFAYQAGNIGKWVGLASVIGGATLIALDTDNIRSPAALGLLGGGAVVGVGGFVIQRSNRGKWTLTYGE